MFCCFVAVVVDVVAVDAVVVAVVANFGLFCC